MNPRIVRGWPLIGAIILMASPSRADIVLKLDGRTIAEFEDYAKSVEAELGERWSGKKAFLQIDNVPKVRETVLHGEFDIHCVSGRMPVDVRDGLIHDWVGSVFIPHTRMKAVLDLLQDFNRHKQIYPEVIASRLLDRKGNDLKGYWRLEKNAVLIVDLDVEQDARYEQVGEGKWICKAYARNIREVEDAGTDHEHKFTVGEGHGYLWRLYAYWSLEQADDGVFAECRTLSLSRDVPPLLSWIIKPFIQDMPRQSLASTLKSTRAALVGTAQF